MATKSNKKTNTRVSKKSKGPAPHLKAWVGVLIVLIIAVVGFLIVRLSNAGGKVYTLAEIDNIYLNLRDNPRRVGPYPDPRSPRGREIVRYTQSSGGRTWNSGCFIALTPEGARVLSSKNGNSAHFSTRRWVQASCDFR